MIDIQLVREEYDTVKENLERREEPELLEMLESLREVDEQWREQKRRVDELRHEQNEASERINELKKQGEDASEAIERAQQVSERVDEAEDELDALEAERDELLRALPNLLHESVPYGADDEENEPVRHRGEPEEHPERASHREIATGIGADFERSAKVAGHGFYYLYGDLARLNQALIQFGIETARDAGYEYTETPLMLRERHVDATADLEMFENQIYEVQEEDLYLIATSEHPLMAQYADEVLRRDDLPVKQCSYSMCFRKEVGTHSADEKGLFRTHQFNKVEMVQFTHPEESWDAHEELLDVSESIFRALDIPYRVVNVCTGDMGKKGAKKYDIEAWFARQCEYKEVVSCTNCTDYQARELGITYQTEDGEHAPVHTLNSTAVATSRALVAILENCQNPDGSVEVPEPLQEYMGTERLEPSVESL